MAINRTSITAQPITENTESIIEIKDTRPDPFAEIDPPEVPGRLIGYYNGASGFVELYVVAGSGRRLLRI